jgi:hypothetical protein
MPDEPKMRMAAERVLEALTASKTMLLRVKAQEFTAADIVATAAMIMVEYDRARARS